MWWLIGAGVIATILVIALIGGVIARQQMESREDDYQP